MSDRPHFKIWLLSVAFVAIVAAIFGGLMALWVGPRAVAMGLTVFISGSLGATASQVSIWRRERRRS